MKQWNEPFVEELSMSATAYNPKGGYIADGGYKSLDGTFTKQTFRTSSGNQGKPGLAGDDPTMGNRGQGTVADGFITWG